MPIQLSHNLVVYLNTKEMKKNPIIIYFCHKLRSDTYHERE